MIKQQFPGKLFVIGEYAAVIPGFTSVIAAISRYLTVEIEHSESMVVMSDHGNLDNLSMQQFAGRMEFVRQSILMAQQIAGIDEPFRLTITSELDSENMKYGFGSSGVVVVAVISAILTHYGINFSKVELFKMAILVQKKLGNLGSGGDIASTIFRGVIAYTRFDSKWLDNYWKNISVVYEEWPLLKIEALDTKNVDLIIGWTQIQNSTSPYVAKFEALKDTANDKFEVLTVESRDIVNRFLIGINNSDRSLMYSSINEYRDWMLKLELVLDVPIEIRTLSHLIGDAIMLGYASKISGAGGGDCGIVLNVWNDYENIEKLRESWLKHGILMLDIEVI